MSTATILAEVQKNPDISTDNATYVTRLIENVKLIIKRYCKLPRYPEVVAGFSKSRVTPTTDLSSLSTNKIWISANGSAAVEITVTLANMATGSAAASELQTQIQAETDQDSFDEITVAYDGTSGAEYYTITSGRYGESSSVVVSFLEDDKHVAQALQLGTLWGGTEEIGSVADLDIDEAAVLLTEALYARAGVEGIKSGTLPSGLSFAYEDWPSYATEILNSRRRLQ